MEMDRIQDKITTVALGNVIGTVTLIVVAACILSYMGTSRILEKVLSSTAEVAANTIYSAVDGKIETLEEFVAQNTFSGEDFDTVELQDKMNSFAQRHDYLAVLYVNADGISTSGRDLSDQTYFIDCKKQMTSGISDIFLEKESDQLYIALIAPVIRNGVFEGAVIASADAGFLSELSNQITFGKTGVSYIIDGEANMIAHQNEDLVYNEVNFIEKAQEDSSYKSTAKFHKKMLKEESGYHIYRHEGKIKIAAYASIGINGWSIAVSGEMHEYLTATYIIVGTILAIAIFTCIIFFYTLKKVVIMITDPISQCVERMKLLAMGDFHSEVVLVDTKDELAELSLSMKSLVLALQKMVEEITASMNQMAEGRFDIATSDNYQGDFAPIGYAMNMILAGLNQTLLTIKGSVGGVALGAGQLSKASSELAQGATEQARYIEEITKMMDGIASQAKENAAFATSAITSANEANEIMNLSRERMDELAKAMDEIATASDQIQNVLIEMEGIAKQTNLLALNASIEAARAGVSGKGFAVIAENVGKLAEDSSSAAKSTRELISNTISLIDAGSRITKETKETMIQMEESVKDSVNLIVKISEGSVSQSESMKEATDGIDHISGIVQMNAASAEETSATSEDLTSQTEVLRSLVDMFRLREQ